MAAVNIPIISIASQTLNVTLSNQACQINIYGKRFYVPQDPVGGIATEPPVYIQINPVFLDLYVNDVAIVLGVLGRSNVRIVRDKYLGFIGDLFFYDTINTDLATAQDPLINGLGSRWLLLYDPDLQ
jgi:hypothetical protein